MINIGVYNDNSNYIDNDKYKFIKFEGDISLMTKHSKTNDDIEIYSQTYSMDANRINDIIYKHNMTNDILIIDGTTSIGGNFLHFIKKFKYNIGIELNKERFIKLNENIKKIDNIQQNGKLYDKPYHYTLNGNKIITINTSILDNKLQEKIFKLYKDTKICIFLDPPWGGKEYKNYDKIVFGLDNIPLKTIINNIREKKKDVMFCIKLPTNYFLESLEGIPYNIYTFKKFIVIYCYI